MRSATVLVFIAASVGAFASLASAADTRASGDPPGAKEFKGCKKVPAGKRVLKLSLKPDSEVSDLVSWMSTVSCTNFLFTPSDLQGKKVTVFSPELLTLDEAYKLFVDALASAGLQVQPLSNGSGKGEALRIFPKSNR